MYPFCLIIKECALLSGYIRMYSKTKECTLCVWKLKSVPFSSETKEGTFHYLSINKGFHSYAPGSLLPINPSCNVDVASIIHRGQSTRLFVTFETSQDLVGQAGYMQSEGGVILFHSTYPHPALPLVHRFTIRFLHVSDELPSPPSPENIWPLFQDLYRRNLYVKK